MIWLTRCLVLLLLVLQPLRGLAAVEVCHCDDRAHSEQTALHHHHDHHDEADEAIADGGLVHGHDHGSPDHDHCKSCLACCNVSSAALIGHAAIFSMARSTFGVGSHVTPFVPASPTETSLRPPIA